MIVSCLNVQGKRRSIIETFKQVCYVIIYSFVFRLNFLNFVSLVICIIQHFLNSIHQLVLVLPKRQICLSKVVVSCFHCVSVMTALAIFSLDHFNLTITISTIFDSMRVEGNEIFGVMNRFVVVSSICDGVTQELLSSLK